MKKLNLFFMAMTMLFMAASLTACSDDDNNGGGGADLPTPQYEQVSGKYAITSEGSPYESIELSASGNYIVTRSYGGYSLATQAAGTARKSMLGMTADKNATRTTSDGYYIYGTFTDLGNNEYALEGFGTIKLVYSGSNVTDIEVTTNGTTQTYTAEKAATMGDDDMSNALCRTWKVEKVRDKYLDKGTGEESDVTVTPENPGEFGSDMGSEVMFSKSGTYLIMRLDGTIDIAEWKWKDRGAGQLYYAWDGEWTGDYATITFDGNRAVVHDKWEDEYGRDESWTYLVAVDAPETPGTDLPEAQSPLANVFTGKLLKQMGDDQFFYENGFLTKIVNDYETLTFRYNYITNPDAGLPDVQVMDGDEVEYEVELNEQGFAERVHGMKYDDISIFTYDEDGHIIKIDDGREGRMYTLTWENGNLVKMTYTREDEPTANWADVYEYDGQPNTNNIMLYYKLFDIDLDEIQNLYYAGLLGRSTAQLPVKQTDTDGSYEAFYVWSENGYTSLEEGETMQPGDEPEVKFSFYD